MQTCMQASRPLASRGVFVLHRGKHAYMLHCACVLPALVRCMSCTLVCIRADGRSSDRVVYRCSHRNRSPSFVQSLQIHVRCVLLSISARRVIFRVVSRTDSSGGTCHLRALCGRTLPNVAAQIPAAELPRLGFQALCRAKPHTAHRFTPSFAQASQP